MIQYYVQPLLEERTIDSGGETFTSGAVFGTSRWFGEDVVDSGSSNNADWMPVPGLFGGVSEKGLYVSDSLAGSSLVQTKLSVPDTFVRI